MENNRENKARFMALYFGQRIMNWHQWDEDAVRSLVDFKVPMRTNKGIDDGWHVELRSLSLITDEEAIDVAEIEGYNDYVNITRSSDGKLYLSPWRAEGEYWQIPFFIINTKEYFMEWDNREEYEENRTLGVGVSAYDYLRSRGFALPYLGLTVEQQVAYGWVNLIII